MVPSIGRIVHYTLGPEDAAAINRRRTTGKSIAERIKSTLVNPQGGPDVTAWPVGAQAHIGNDAHEGDVVPLIIVKVWSATTVNGQAFLDSNDVLWVTSATEGIGPHTWCWPPKV